MTLREELVFTQTNLQDYVDCKRRFELRYIDRLRYPAPQAQPMLEHEERMRQGDQFHRLVHQTLLGVPAEKVGQQINDDRLQRWWDHFMAWGFADVPAQRLPEKELSLPFGGYRLLAKFDLLAFDAGGDVLIVDWKTSRSAPKQATLANRLQTRVYRYVVTACAGYLYGGDIPPERVRMMYWYPHTGESVSLPYDRDQYAADGDYLTQLIAEIAKNTAWPLTEDARHCRFCTYRSLCDRGRVAGDMDDFDVDDAAPDIDDFDIDLDQIAEIEF